MSVTRAGVTLLILFAGLVGGCSSYPKPQNKPEERDQRTILNEGYSLLYSSISSIAHGNLLLLFKVESDTLEQVVKEVAEYAGTLKKTLERIAQDYPAIDIKLEPLPVMEKRTRDALVRSRLLSFAPIVGLTGIDFERRVLQTLEGPLNHLRSLCEVMADEEPEPSLKHVLTDAQSKLDRLLTRVTDLLNEQYYIKEP